MKQLAQFYMFILKIEKLDYVFVTEEKIEASGFLGWRTFFVPDVSAFC